jgi:hypothetical protein
MNISARKATYDLGSPYQLFCHMASFEGRLRDGTLNFDGKLFENVSVTVERCDRITQKFLLPCWTM